MRLRGGGELGGDVGADGGWGKADPRSGLAPSATGTSKVSKSHPGFQNGAELPPRLGKVMVFQNGR
jgi:hypothetical protein